MNQGRWPQFEEKFPVKTNRLDIVSEFIYNAPISVRELE